MNLKLLYDRLVKNYFYYLDDPVIRFYDNGKLISEYDYCVEKDNQLMFVDNTARLPAFCLPINKKVSIQNDCVVINHESKNIVVRFLSCDSPLTNLEYLVNEY